MDLGDQIGMESYIEMKSDLDIDLFFHCGGDDGGDWRMQSKKEKKPVKVKTEREFPPPLPCIPLTENLRRYYTADGRLIIVEMKADYLRARRSSGRLTLELVTTNHGVSGGNVDGTECEKCECLNDVVLDEEVESGGCLEEECDDREINGGDEMSIFDRVEAASVDRMGVIGGTKCYRYNSWGAFDIGSLAVRPVHI